MDEIRDELRKRNLDNILKEEPVFNNTLEDDNEENNELTKEERRAEMEERRAEMEERRKNAQEELEEQLSDKFLTFDKDPVNFVKLLKWKRNARNYY